MRLLKNKLYKLKVISSILNNHDAIKIGPRIAQIDITNRCNNKCIACWVRSPLLENLEASNEWKNKEISFGKIKELLDSLAKLHTQKIVFSGGGEPFIHPDITRVLEFCKKKGFEIELNTNFTLINKELSDKIIPLDIDLININFGAGDAETYSKVHVNQSKEIFNKIIENLKYFNKTKRGKPRINIINVITNLNFKNIKDMIKIAFETKSEIIDFVMVDTVKGKTDKLLLDNEQIKELLAQFKKVPELLEIYEKKYDHHVSIPLLEQIVTKLSNKESSEGVYYANLIESIPCYAGFLFTRISATGNVDPCLKAHRIPVGNIYEDSFKKIWNSERQREFRRSTNSFKKTEPYFLNIGEDSSKSGCYTSCDNFNENFNLFNDISKLKNWQKKSIKLIF